MLNYIRALFPNDMKGEILEDSYKEDSDFPERVLWSLAN